VIAKCILRGLSIVLLVMATGGPVVARQPAPWFRSARLEGAYDLRGVKILVVASADFNYQETIEIPECWKRWGASVEYAGPERTLTGEDEPAPGERAASTPATLRVDYLLAEAGPARYDVLYVAGGEGVQRLLAGYRPDLARLIDGARARGSIVSAICHGPVALAASIAVRGRRVTVQGTPERQALEQAGASVVTEIAVVDDWLVTGQWPHLEEFAVTLAERVQYPGGGGPREKALAARSLIERAVDDLRDAYVFDGRPVPPEAMEALARAAQRAVAARGSRGSRAMRMVVVAAASTKAQFASLLAEKGKSWFVALGMPETAVKARVGAMLEGAPVLLFQFVEAPPGTAAGARDRTLRADAAFAGAAAANVALVARSMGLAVSAIGMPPFLEAEADVREILQVPDTQVLVGIYGLGYPTAAGTPAVARPASDLLFFERWGGAGTRR
jgi:putative intracellular protease/amidase/nitroreductase